MDSAAPLSVFVIGTRAQLIKVAPVIVACERQGQAVLLLLTGQHKETMADLVTEFGIRAPQEGSERAMERSTVLSLFGWLPKATFHLIRRLRGLRQQYAAVHVVVHGDTLSTLIGAFAGKWTNSTVFHLESGLTSGKLLDPFPEELTRRMVFRLADVALCPGQVPSDYMRQHHNCQVVDTISNTIVDSVMMAALTTRTDEDGPDGQPYLVVSLHRFQNIFDSNRLRYLAELITGLAGKYSVHFVLHPATRKRLLADGLMATLSGVPNLLLSPRLGYRDFLGLASAASCVLTDGGSNQEELAVLGVPTIVMRQHTERMDGLGENAIMESVAGDNLLQFILGGKHEMLRRPSLVGKEFGPSRLVADVLAQHHSK